MSSRRKASSFGCIVTRDHSRDRPGPYTLTAEERITNPQRAPAGDCPAKGAAVGRGRRLPCGELRDRRNVRKSFELVPPSAAEPLPPPQPPSTAQLHLPSGPKSRRSVTSGFRTTPSVAVAAVTVRGGPGLSRKAQPPALRLFTFPAGGADQVQPGVLPLWLRGLLSQS